MSVDWGFAGQVGGVGFGVVCAVLVILGIVIWLVGMILGKFSAGNTAAKDKAKGD